MRIDRAAVALSARGGAAAGPPRRWLGLGLRRPPLGASAGSGAAGMGRPTGTPGLRSGRMPGIAAVERAGARSATGPRGARRSGARGGGASSGTGRSCAGRSSGPPGGGRLGPPLADAGLLGVVPGAAPRGAVRRLDAGLAQDLGERASSRVRVPVRFGHHAPPNESSLRRMTPSRSAHGQIRTHGTSRRRIAAAATTAPAGTWCARSTDTPAQLGQRGGLDPRHEADELVQSLEGAAAAAPGARRSTAPRRSAGPGSGTSCSWRPPGPARPPSRSFLRRPARAGPRRASSQLAPARRGPGGRRSGRPGRNRRVIRPAPSGSDSATSGSSSMPAASSSEPPPMSRTSSRPALQPNQRRTARKVSRASSSPVSTCRSTPVRVADPVEHLRAVGRRRGSPR